MSFLSGSKTIVVATDMHGQAEAALEYARKLATAYGARIVLAHGLDPLEYAAISDVPASVLEHMTHSARAALDKLGAELLQEGIPSHSEVRQGAVAEMIIDVAKQYDAGLIAIGTAGREGAGPVVVGAVAEKLVRQALCPVLAVAADWNAGACRPAPGGAVLLAIEENAAAAEAAATALSLAETFARPLLILHARTGAERKGAAAKAFRLEDYGIHPRRGILIQEIVRNGGPAEETADAIGEYHPCILVVGAKRTSDTPGCHGTAFSLMTRSRVPVLCVPPMQVPGPIPGQLGRSAVLTMQA